MTTKQTIDEKVKEQFELTCKKCGSKNVVINFYREHIYSEETVDPAEMTIGCNDCKQNDFYA